MRRAVYSALLLLSACAATSEGARGPLAGGAKYVAMGSSYAAGAWIGPLAPDSPRRCGRTINNYPRLLAAKLQLALVDVSCSGATTAHILGRWSELPAQIDAVTPDTRLVTITIGGNDLGYVRTLMMAICGRFPDAPVPGGGACQPVTWPGEADYAALDRQLRQIAQAVARRAPKARLVFVDYVQILPDQGGCATVPLDDAHAAAARATFARMAAITAQAAKAEGAMLLPAGALSKGHDACSAAPWSAGHPGKPLAWHPLAEGHAAIADALAARLK